LVELPAKFGYGCGFMKLRLITLAGWVCALSVHAQLITGVADRVVYTDQASFNVPTNAGFTYEATLNGMPVAAGVTHTITRSDYYDLFARRVLNAGGVVSNQLIRFIVLSSNRGNGSDHPERGLIEFLPYPPIPSGSDEFAGGQLNVVAPANYPAGLEIPVVAWVDNSPGNARRVNGHVSAAGFPSLPLYRGVGHTFLPAATAGGALNYNAAIQVLSTNKAIKIDSSTTWSNVSGTLPVGAVWPANSRIRVTGSITISAGSTLTIEAGTIVQLNASVNITNSGRTVINGTTERPVVFTAANRVAPESHTGAWGGFLLRGASAQLIANGAIMTGAGAASSFDFSPGASHRSEQALLLVHGGARASLTNCFLISNAGQIGNGDNSDITYDHCLLQRAITAGEYEGGTIIVNNSAVIEFPAVDGVVNASIAEADYDAIYFTTGTHILRDSLFGFCKDDAVDSGSGGPGTVVVTNCWVESAFHEALAWSGEGRQTWTYDTTVMNSGQGFECGWSTGANSPLCFGDRLLSLGNSVGARYGDNYEGTSGLGLKDGFLTVTNSIILHNYRDVWGQVWDNTWNYRAADMDIRANFVTAPNTNHPNNTVWDPAVHASRLAPFMHLPANAKVGVGFANWNPLTLRDLTNGIPLRLSIFTTNVVSFDYAVQTPNSTLAQGTLTFQPGETVKRIYAPMTGVSTQDLVRISLSNPVACEFTTDSELLIAPAAPNATVPLIALNSAWRYFDNGTDLGVAWRATNYNDTTWSNGVAQLGYGDSPRDENTFIRRTNSGGTVTITFYFRHAFQVANPAQFASLGMRLLRDDAGVVYINGREVYRSPNLPTFPTAINYLTEASSTGENNIDVATLNATNLVAGNNVIAVEIHQESTGSSDVSFDFELTGNLVGGPPRLNLTRFGDDFVLHWSDPAYHLESSEELGSTWSPVLGAISPVTIAPTTTPVFYRLAR
jgi:hypothetical protein